MEFIEYIVQWTKTAEVIQKSIRRRQRRRDP